MLLNLILGLGAMSNPNIYIFKYPSMAANAQAMGPELLP
jgi:hypothetical protein